MKKKNKKYKYPYITDKSLYKAVVTAKKMLTDGIFFKRAVKWAANKTKTNPRDVEHYLSVFLGCDTEKFEELKESDNSDLTPTLIDIKGLVNESLSCVYWSEGDGMTNHHLYSIEEHLNEINSLLDWCIDE